MKTEPCLMTAASEVSITGSAPSGVAAIATLDMVATTLERLTHRRAGVPGIGVLYGPAGWGKTFCTNALANAHRAYYVQLLSAWRSRDVLEKILLEMGITHAPMRISKLLDRVIEQLAASGRTLILDEFDHAVRYPKLIELIRDIYEGSQGALLLVGEELLPRKLEASERFYSRISVWAPAQPITLPDIERLAPLYCPGIVINAEAKQAMVRLCQGSVRRVVTCLSSVYEYAQTYALEEVGPEGLSELMLPGDRAPQRRR